MSDGHPPCIVLSAGEASGDRLGAGLALALRRRRPDLRLVGMGGERMARAGVEILQDSSEVAVVGIVEVLRHLPALRRAMDRLVGCLAEGPALLVPIDYPEFHMRLAARAGERGVPVVWFVSPQIWAWRKGRVKKIRRLVRKMLVLFPFEVEFYRQAQVPVVHVGHPVVEPPESGPTREELCRATGLDPERRIVALMPGSRRSEVGRLLSDILGAATRLHERDPTLQFLLPVAPGIDRAWLESGIAQAGVAVALTPGPFPQVLEHCAAGVVASGTASLEAASTGLPIVVVYRVSGLSYVLARWFVDLPHVALPNLIADRRVVPELIQGECRPDRIAQELARYLEDPDHARRVREELTAVRDLLGAPGIYERAAEAVLATLDQREDAGGPDRP